MSRIPRTTAAINDALASSRQWRSWWVLAINDVRQRYRRSHLGQFWLSISLGATILGMGLVFAVVMNHPLDEYMLFLGTGMIIWGFISSMILELATCFIASESFIKSYPGPKLVVVLRTILRNSIISAHNLILLPVMWIAFGSTLTWTVLLVLPGLALAFLNFLWIGMLLSPLCARFRDIPQIVQSLLQLLFFITPIIYRPGQIEAKLPILTHYNPLANLVEILRAPLLGHIPDLQHYAILCIFTAVGYAIAVPFYVRFRERIIYWL